MKAWRVKYANIFAKKHVVGFCTAKPYYIFSAEKEKGIKEEEDKRRRKIEKEEYKHTHTHTHTKKKKKKKKKILHIVHLKH